MSFDRQQFSGQAGYPRGAFTGNFDPAMGRGYRIGDFVVIPPNTYNHTLVNHGSTNLFFRWKVTLYADSAPDGIYAANTSYYLTVRIAPKAENDEITRVVQIQRGGTQIVYGPGRTLVVTVDNPTNQPLVIHYNLDEATPGLSPFRGNAELLADAGVAEELLPPPFATDLQLFGVAGGTGWILRGWNLSGTLVYEEVLAVPRSASIPILPTLRYTLEPAVGLAQTAVIQYSCVG